ncbi:unnamed protein product [Strongylus vulgaris]|uniref:EGF-like domain-containing protein n=1 Tax=Strongylus vulgaris TaxID=40348 RepID=A0A3P7LK17_STRVU|nr:unnamed protein product [Strongylus vulgaris]
MLTSSLTMAPTKIFPNRVISEPNLTDICAIANPCQNNGTCIFVWKKNTHYCKCQPGYTGNNCTEKIDFDPCASNPCQNGATCTAKVQQGKPTYECYCAPGFGGPKCDQRPCDVNPCLHNGTCRTTAGFSSYFCDCKDGYGGKNCDIVSLCLANLSNAFSTTLPLQRLLLKHLIMA